MEGYVSVLKSMCDYQINYGICFAKYISKRMIVIIKFPQESESDKQ